MPGGCPGDFKNPFKSDQTTICDCHKTEGNYTTKQPVEYFGDINYFVIDNGPCHVTRNFLPFKEKSPFLSSQAASFFSFAKGIFFPYAKESRSHDTGHC
jgi:hypothetical protein